MWRQEIEEFCFLASNLSSKKWVFHWDRIPVICYIGSPCFLTINLSRVNTQGVVWEVRLLLMTPECSIRGPKVEILLCFCCSLMTICILVRNRWWNTCLFLCQPCVRPWRRSVLSELLALAFLKHGCCIWVQNWCISSVGPVFQMPKNVKKKGEGSTTGIFLLIQK